MYCAGQDLHGLARLAKLARLAVGLRWNLVMQYWAKVRWSPPSTDAQTSFQGIRDKTLERFQKIDLISKLSDDTFMKFISKEFWERFYQH